MLAPVALALLLSSPLRAHTGDHAFPPVRCVTILSNLEHSVKDMEEANRAMDEAYSSGNRKAFDKAVADWAKASNEYNTKLAEWEKGQCTEHGYGKAPQAPKQWERPKSD